MGDTFKCKNCGTVVETLQSCPSCGEAAMRPVQSQPDSDLLSDIGDPEGSEASDSDEQPNTAQPETVTTGDDEPSEAEPADTDDPETTSARSRKRAGREPQSQSGLLAWLKSLF